MDLTILTTFFCLILLVLSVLALNELMILKRKVNAHLDRSDLHSDKLATILSILQQIEAKQDLIFNNAPPAPGECSKEDAPEDHSWHNPRVRFVDQDRSSDPEFPIHCLPRPIAGHFTHSEVKVSTTVPTEIIPPVNVPFAESRYGQGVPRPPKKTRSVEKAAQKAKSDFDARLPYHMSKIDNGVIPLEAPKRGARLGVKRGPYKKKASN